MSNMIGIVGESGTGKSTSLETLDPKITCIVNATNKPLPFKGSKKKYNLESNNYLESDNWQEICAYLKYVNKDLPHIKNIILDDIGLTMSSEFMRRSDESGFDKFNQIGAHMFNIINTAKDLRDDLNVIFMWHSENVFSDGVIVDKNIATVGNMIDKYFKPKALFTTLLFTNVDFDKKTESATYQFVTNKTRKYPAKSPRDMFTELYIPNDMTKVLESIEAYYN